jgi:hypothetical protein
MAVAEKPHMENILDKRVSKRTKRREYFEYLVKWKGHPVEDASWENQAKIQKHGQTVQELMDRAHENFQAREYDAGASPASSERGESANAFWHMINYLKYYEV